VATDELSAGEAALIAQARAELGKTAAAAAAERPLAPGNVEHARPDAAATPAVEATPAVADPPAVAAAPPAADPQQRIAALMAAARAESERVRLRRRRLYVWLPTAFTTILGLWALLWMWHSL
jgi:hypothetical protein